MVWTTAGLQHAEVGVYEIRGLQLGVQGLVVWF